MNFNKTTEYSLRILGYMSLNENELYTAKDLAKILQIPYSYLRTQLKLLSKKGILVSIQGKQGGFKIANNLEKISLFDIVNATEDFGKENMCFFGFRECPLQNRCSMHEKWGEVRDKTFGILKTTTLLDIKNENTALSLSTK
jgi:Rrf2 family nitric oxide-sensitive transcriptional repressor